MVFKFSFITLLAIGLTACSQPDFGKLEILSSLPGDLSEVSGIEIVNGSSLLWMINDSGNSPRVYGYDINERKIARTIELSVLKNTDWEDLASDTEGNLYIGDFGNNDNKRKDLAIYRLGNVATSDSMEIEITRFQFEDQKEFPPKKKERNFDVEAFVFYQGNFYLFTRNRSSNFDGTTKLYRVPAGSGDVQATYLGSYVTCQDKDDCQVTSAAIDRKTGDLALLTYNKIFLFSKFNGGDVFKRKAKEIHLDHKSQKESVVFLDAKTMLIADEKVGPEGGNLYKYTFKK